MRLVAAEKINICFVEDYMQAFAVWFVCHYVFNCSFHKNFKQTLTFIEKAILQIYAPCKTPFSYLLNGKDWYTKLGLADFYSPLSGQGIQILLRKAAFPRVRAGPRCLDLM